jgi:hypothetical protein
MLFRYFKIVYLNGLIVLALFLNMPLLLIIFFLIRSSSLIWRISIEQLSFSQVYASIDDDWLVYVDYDTDFNYYFRLLKSEHYSWFNCYFIFDHLGGETVLSSLDFLNVIKYNTFDQRNLKYSYRDNFYKKKYKSGDYFFSYYFNSEYIKAHNIKRNLKLLSGNTYNIFNNHESLQKLNKVKASYYIALKNKKN